MGHRIGYGSYEKPNREQSKEDLRNRFLEAVSEYAKHVLEDLHGEPFKLYLEAGLGFKVRERTWDKHTMNHPLWQDKFETGPIARGKYKEQKEQLRQSLFEWSRRSHLDAAWCRESAYETLDNWSYSQPTSEHLCFQPLLKMRMLFSTGRKAERFTFECLAPHPQLIPSEIIEAEIRRKFDRQLKTFLRQLNTRAKEQGYVLTPEEYKSKYGEGRFRWLVEWVVNEKSFQAIVNENNNSDGGPEHSTVRKTLIELAKAIELPYPPAKKS